MTKSIALEHALDALADDHRREQLGERGGDRLQQGLLAHEMHIGLDGELRARQQPAQRGDVFALEPEPVGELEPARDAAVAFMLAVMIVQARAPLAAHVRVLAARDQARVLQRDHRLVIVAVERPGLHLSLGALAAVQQAVERMQAMIALRADVAQLGLEFVRRHQLHRRISSPSAATSHPAASTRCALGRAVDQDRIGVVDVDVDPPLAKPRPAR